MCLLKSQKKNQLVSDDEVKIRQLQFILDFSKRTDKFRLNHIWSIYNQMHKKEHEADVTKKQENQKEYNQAVAKSDLPPHLKENLTIGVNEQFKEKSFGHLINKYYKTRRKAREGRYFLHQFKKEKWLDEGKTFGHLLTQTKTKKNTS